MVLRFPQDIQRAKAANTWINRPTVQKVEVDLNLDQQRSRQIAAKVKALFNDGAYLWTLISFAVSFSALILGCYLLNNEISWSVVGISCGISLLVSITIKLFGLYITHLKLEAELQALEELIDQEKHGQILMVYDSVHKFGHLTGT